MRLGVGRVDVHLVPVGLWERLLVKGGDIFDVVFSPQVY